MKTTRKTVAIFIALVMLLALFPASAFAATVNSRERVISLNAADVSEIRINTVGNTNWHYTAVDSTYHIVGGSREKGDAVVITGTSQGTTSKGIIIEASCDVILDGVDITSSRSVIELRPGVSATLYLTESKNKITTISETAAAIQTTGATLIIDGKGSLTATGGTYGAAIGGSGGVVGLPGLPALYISTSPTTTMIDSASGGNGGNGNGAGSIIIKSGIIKAIGNYGAGIGSGAGGLGGPAVTGSYTTTPTKFPNMGFASGNGGNGGNGGIGGAVAIEGGTITAKSTYGAGIGGGAGGGGSDGGYGITGHQSGCNGGNGGAGGYISSVTIKGGTVIAESGNFLLFGLTVGGVSAGIGGASGGTGGRGGVIDGWDITFVSGNAGNAGNGGGGATFTMSGGYLKAKSRSGAGIGGGAGARGGLGGESKSSLGVSGLSGNGGAGGTFSINDGTVEAESTYGAGIGGGNGGNGQDGGSGTQYSGSGSLNGYPGRNGGTGGNGGTVNISGGSIKAKSVYGADIGGGAGGAGGTGGSGNNGSGRLFLGVISNGTPNGNGGAAGNGGNGGSSGAITISGETEISIGGGTGGAFGQAGAAGTGGIGGVRGANGFEGLRGRVGSLNISPALGYDWTALYIRDIGDADRSLITEQRGSYPATPFINNSSYISVYIITRFL